MALSTLTQPLSPRAVAAGDGRDKPLDGLRGLCALAVFYSHLVMPVALDPGFTPQAPFQRLNIGFAGVLMFFVISGYAIGLATQTPANGAEIKTYVSRRLWRLTPINTVAVLLSWLVLPTLAWDMIVGNLLFLQNQEISYAGWKAALLPNNTNLWTLHFEMVYYLCFLALWVWPTRTLLVWTVVLALTLMGAVVDGFPTAIARFACGGLYWIAGLSAAWLLPRVPAEPRSAWPSALLAALAIWCLAPLRSLFFLIGWNSWLWPTPVSPHRLDFLPACVWVLLAVTGRGEALQRVLGLFCLAWTTGYLALRAAGGGLSTDEIFAGALLLLALALCRFRPKTGPLGKLAPIGAISFAIYAIGAPVQFWVLKHLPLPQGSWASYLVRVGIAALATGALAWLLDGCMQPWLRRRFARRHGPGAAPVG